MEQKNSNVRHILKGTLYGVTASLVLVLVFALVESMVGLGSGAITIVAQIIKVVSIFFGVSVALRGIERRGWLHGGIIGILHTAVTFLIFSIISSGFEITTGILTEILFAIVIGAASAVLLAMGRNRTA